MEGSLCVIVLVLEGTNHTEKTNLQIGLERILHMGHGVRFHSRHFLSAATRRLQHDDFTLRISVWNEDTVLTVKTRTIKLNIFYQIVAVKELRLRLC